MNRCIVGVERDIAGETAFGANEPATGVPVLHRSVEIDLGNQFYPVAGKILRRGELKAAVFGVYVASAERQFEPIDWSRLHFEFQALAADCGVRRDQVG